MNTSLLAPENAPLFQPISHAQADYHFQSLITFEWHFNQQVDGLAEYIRTRRNPRRDAPGVVHDQPQPYVHYSEATQNFADDLNSQPGHRSPGYEAQAWEVIPRQFAYDLKEAARLFVLAGKALLSAQRNEQQGGDGSALRLRHGGDQFLDAYMKLRSLLDALEANDVRDYSGRRNIAADAAALLQRDADDILWHGLAGQFDISPLTPRRKSDVFKVLDPLAALREKRALGLASRAVRELALEHIGQASWQLQIGSDLEEDALVGTDLRIPFTDLPNAPIEDETRAHAALATFALVKGGAPVTIEEVALALAQPGIAKTSFWMLYKPEARAKKGAETAALTIATSLRNNAFLPGFNEAAQAALHTLEDAAADIATTDIVPAYAPPPVVKSDKLLHILRALSGEPQLHNGISGLIGELVDLRGQRFVNDTEEYMRDVAHFILATLENVFLVNAQPPHAQAAMFQEMLDALGNAAGPAAGQAIGH